MQKIIRQIAAEIKVTEQQINAAVELLDGGATVPFIARYPSNLAGLVWFGGRRRTLVVGCRYLGWVRCLSIWRGWAGLGEKIPRVVCPGYQWSFARVAGACLRRECYPMTTPASPKITPFPFGDKGVTRTRG
jgi:hypothetical protein